MAGRFGLSKEERLRRKKDIQKIFHAGRRAGHPWVSVVVRHPTGESLRRLAVVVGRKYGNAVRRNRIKRLIREVFRLNKHSLKPGTDTVFLPKPSAQGCEFSTLTHVLIGLWKKAGVWEGS